MRENSGRWNAMSFGIDHSRGVSGAQFPWANMLVAGLLAVIGAIGLVGGDEFALSVFGGVGDDARWTAAGVILSPFLHANAPQLIINVWLLMVFGGLLACAMRPLHYLLLCVFIAVFAAAAAALGGEPGAGGAGLLYGVMAFFLYPYAQVWVSVIPGITRRSAMRFSAQDYFPFAARLPSFTLVAGYGLADFLLFVGGRLDKYDWGAAYAAHLGGFIAGLIAGFYFFKIYLPAHGEQDEE
jgi:membrane associated rhomboid family serine protease